MPVIMLLCNVLAGPGTPHACPAMCSSAATRQN